MDNQRNQSVMRLCSIPGIKGLSVRRVILTCSYIFPFVHFCLYSNLVYMCMVCAKFHFLLLFLFFTAVAFYMSANLIPFAIVTWCELILILLLLFCSFCCKFSDFGP